MRRPRPNHSPAFKAKVARAALTSDATTAALASRVDVYAHRITQWKRLLVAQAAAAFSGKGVRTDASPIERQAMINREHDLSVMRRRDALLRVLPFAGRRMLRDLSRGLVINRPNHVWATDITNIPMARAFVFLCAILDWASRNALAWRISATLTSDFCIAALEETIDRYGAPEIFTTDQGSPFTSYAFLDVQRRHHIQIRLDGRGCWRDNVFVGRLWRSVKYEDVYLRAYEIVSTVRAGLKRYLTSFDAHGRRWPDTQPRLRHLTTGPVGRDSQRECT